MPKWVDGYAVSMMIALVLGCFIGPILFMTGARADDLPAAELWQRLRGDGHVLLLRHARAPGTFDPPGFSLGDCATQRNLSDEGRAQARALGEMIRANGVKIGRVLSSRWCRAKDTARLAFGDYEESAVIDSFRAGDATDRPERERRLRDMIEAWLGPGTLVLVSHQFTLSDIAGRSLRETEPVVVKRGANGGIDVLGALPGP